jgi:hypothetical protein
LTNRKDKASTKEAAVVFMGVVVAILAPVGISLWAIYNEINARRHRHVENANDLVSPEEKIQYIEIKTCIEAFDAKFDELINYGVEVEKIPLRQDGVRFDARRPGAKRLNSELDVIDNSKVRLLQGIELIKSQLKNRTLSWIQGRAALAGSRCALIVFCLVFVTVSICQGRNVSPIRILFGHGDDAWGRVVASLVSTVAAGLALWGASSATRRRLIAEASI